MYRRVDIAPRYAKQVRLASANSFDFQGIEEVITSSPEPFVPYFLILNDFLGAATQLFHHRILWSLALHRMPIPH